VNRDANIEADHVVFNFGMGEDLPEAHVWFGSSAKHARQDAMRDGTKSDPARM
jgi:hypothetical protein